MKPIHILFSLLLASTYGLPVHYDQRQDGDLNVHAHLENFIIVLIPSSGSYSLLANLLKKDAGQVQKPTSEKHIPHATGTKVSAPDFPAAKSPYKVDLDKNEGEISKVQETVGDDNPVISIGEEVVIAQAPSSLVSKSQTKEGNEVAESTTVMFSDEDITTAKSLADEPGATEKVEKEGANDEAVKKENDVEKTGSKEDKVEEEKNVMKDEMKADKKDKEKNPMNEEMKEEEKEKTEDVVNLEEIPVIDSAPVKPTKSSKSIEFGIEAARSTSKIGEVDESPRLFSSQRIKTFKVPIYRHEISSTSVTGNPGYAQQLKMLRTGLDGCEPGEILTENGDCQPVKTRQRSGQYFRTEDRLLPILQFGLSPANSE